MARFLDIIIPEYNCKEEFMKRLLHSISRQKNVDFNEIGVIIVNDNSKDKLKKSLFKNYPTLNIEYYIKDINEGIGMTRQYGFDKSNATYVTFWDQDDELYGNDSLGKIISNLKKNNLDVIATQYIEEVRNKKGEVFELLHDKLDGKEVLHGVFIKKEFVLRNNIKFVPGIRYHDDSYYRRVLMFMSPMYFVNELTYVWKSNVESVVRRKRNYSYLVETFEDYYKALINASRFSKERNIPQTEYIVNAILGLFIILKSVDFAYNELDEYREKCEHILFEFISEFNYEVEISKSKYDYLYDSQYELIQYKKASDETLFEFISRMKNKYPEIPYKDMEFNKKMDVIIPYNSRTSIRNYLDRILKSVKNQMWINIFEIGFIIVLYDSSIDNLNDVLDNYKVLSVKVINLKNENNYGKAIQAGIDESNADFITIINQSDMFAGQYVFYDLINEIKSNKSDIINTNFYMYNSDTNDKRIFTHLNLQCLYGTVYRRSALVNGNYRFISSLSEYEDLYFSIITSKTLKTSNLNIVSYIWYSNINCKGNVLSRTINNSMKDFMVANIEAIYFINKKNVDIIDFTKATFYYLFILVYSKLFTDKSISDYEKILVDFYNEIKNRIEFNVDKDDELIKACLNLCNGEYGITEIGKDLNEFINEKNI